MSQRLIPTGRTIFVADAHRGDGRRFVVRADELVGPYCGIPRRINVLIRRRVPGVPGKPRCLDEREQLLISRGDE